MPDSAQVEIALTIEQRIMLCIMLNSAFVRGIPSEIVKTGKLVARLELTPDEESRVGYVEDNGRITWNSHLARQQEPASFHVSAKQRDRIKAVLPNYGDYTKEGLALMRPLFECLGIAVPDDEE